MVVVGTSSPPVCSSQVGPQVCWAVERWGLTESPGQLHGGAPRGTAEAGRERRCGSGGQGGWLHRGGVLGAPGSPNRKGGHGNLGAVFGAVDAGLCELFTPCLWRRRWLEVTQGRGCGGLGWGEGWVRGKAAQVSEEQERWGWPLTWFLSPVGPSPGLFTCGPRTWLAHLWVPHLAYSPVGPSPGLSHLWVPHLACSPVDPSPELAPPVGPVGHGEAPCLQLLDVHGQEMG